MNAERWGAMKQLFFAALDHSPPTRPRFLARACAGDPLLATEVSRLVRQHQSMGSFLEAEADDVTDRAVFAPGLLVAQRFRILHLAGTGGMGEVYAAEDRELGGQVALKVALRSSRLDPFALDRLRREVSIARQITHRNVCRVYDIARHRQGREEIAFFTMEWLPGQTLSALLRQSGSLPSAEVARLARQLCLGLATAHRLGIAHGDLKCGNLMLSPHPRHSRLTILDFGLARHLRDRPLTPGGFAGTPDYLAPEQIEAGQATPASDIYTAGMVLHQALTGVRPQRGELSSLLPPEWRAPIRRCLQREPDQRFRSPAELARSLPSMEK